MINIGDDDEQISPEDVFISMADYHLAQDNFTWPESNMIHKLSLKQNLEIYVKTLQQTILKSKQMDLRD